MKDLQFTTKSEILNRIYISFSRLNNNPNIITDFGTLEDYYMTLDDIAEIDPTKPTIRPYSFYTGDSQEEFEEICKKRVERVEQKHKEICDIF